MPDLPVTRAAAGPRLPDAVADAPADETPDGGAASPRGTLRAGCHLVAFTRDGGPLSVRYVGTLRVEREETGTVASGDLYLHGVVGEPPDLLPEEADPGAGIPIFARSRYRYYIRVTGPEEPARDGAAAVLRFELYRYDHPSNTWSAEGTFSAELHQTAAPGGYPHAEEFLRGEVRDSSGRQAGEITIGWVSPFVRRATLEIDRVADCERPLANAAGVDWRAIFEQVGWDLTVGESDADLPEPSGESWSPAELHAALRERRDSADLDSEWRYWLVCVRRIDTEERGLMFDDLGGDSNAIPREGAAIASHWTIPETPDWGLVQGMRFGSATDPYFRTALHEIGHAMGLYHNSRGTSIMRPTDVVADLAVPPEQFPRNVVWSFLPEDGRRLRHLPDLWVRPGGVPYGTSYGIAPDLPADAVRELDGLQLEVTSLLAGVPIGAPVRLNMILRNGAAKSLPAPTDLSLKSGHASGSVTDPSGETRSFRPLLRRTEPRRVEHLAPGESRAASMTLLRGREGALFAMPGPHRVRVRLEWDSAGVPVCVRGETTLMVLPALDQAHADAALHILDTPGVLITLALSGDHQEDGIAAVHAALASDVLRPHFAYVEARRLASRFLRRSPDLAAAADIVEPEAVMSAAEVDKASRILQVAVGQGEERPDRLIGVLEAKAKELQAYHVLDRLARL
jgi:hypothetical protein